MTEYRNYKIWLITGSQHLYGEEILETVKSNSKQIANYLDSSSEIPVGVVFREVVTTSELIAQICVEANIDPECIGIVFWMHTFSPAKMWINGLRQLNKPFLHLHTQFNVEIPWSGIDMDFMNLNQSAHGDREFGHMVSRLGINRKVVVGHWKQRNVIEKIGIWSRAALAYEDSRKGKIARIGDNMREVAVTEGDKVEAQKVFGYSVNGYGVGDLVAYIEEASEASVGSIIEEYENNYEIQPELLKNGNRRQSLVDAARIEIGLETFLKDGGFTGFTDTFENLHGLNQLPGISVQRLMEKGYGFGAEGDWKTAALVRAMKVMATGMEGGNSFMEDYTYHFNNGSASVLGAHMLEICPSITNEKPRCEVHPLSIGGKEDPVRLVFNGDPGDALNATIVDMGRRFRLIINEVEALEINQTLPKLPVARVLWQPKPNFQVAAEAWILAGGAHHTCFSQNLKQYFSPGVQK
jgi:L-arabinose isomerase